MSNTKLKEGLGEIAREVAVLPGITLADVALVGEKTLSITAKIDKTNGLDFSAVSQEIGQLNPKTTLASSAAPVPESPAGLVGALAAVPMLTELTAEMEDWLASVGVADHENNLDGEQGTHSDALDDLHSQSCDCADSIEEIDASADCGMQTTIDVILDLIAAFKNYPLVDVGSTVLAPILEGLLCIEGTVDDRNNSIGDCYNGLRQLCDDAGQTTPPAPKHYSPPVAECPPPAAPAPAPEACPTTPAQTAPTPTPAPPAPAPQPVAPQPVAECPPERAPAPPPAPETAPKPAAPAPSHTTVPASAGLGAGVNINVTIDANIDVGLNGAVAEAPAAPTLPAQCPDPVIPAPPAVPPVGPAGECVVNQIVAGLEAFGQSVAECLEQIECPVEPAEDCPEPEPEPEPEPTPEPECPEETPEPARKPEPEPEPEPVSQPECEEGTIKPPAELAEVKEPPPPPKKGLVEPAIAVSGEDGAQAEQPVEQQPTEQSADTAAEQPANDAQSEDQGEQHRARKTGGW